MSRYPPNETDVVEGNYVRKVLGYINELNESPGLEELACIEKMHVSAVAIGDSPIGSEMKEKAGCEVSWDSLLCWPETPAGSLAIIPCFDELNGIPYDNSREYAYLLDHYCI
ncbi:hypothetical protein KM043_016100 [Ampulex compressa]|nr:hypothetical protein KM043_016100 [Ampulex compressa]